MSEALYKHAKRGTIYRVLHFATLQIEGQLDYAVVIVYQDIESLQVWVRPNDEFFDGRFEEL